MPFGSLLTYLLFRDYSVKNIFLGIKRFCFSRQKAENFIICLKLNFLKPHKISTHSAHSIVIFFLIGCLIELKFCDHEILFSQMLKVSAFYLEEKNQAVVNIKTKKLCLLTQFSVKILIQLIYFYLTHVFLVSNDLCRCCGFGSCGLLLDVNK